MSQLEPMRFDTQDLTREPSAEDRADLKARERSGEFGRGRRGGASLLLVVVFLFFFLNFFVGIVLSLAEGALKLFRQGQGVFPLAIMAPFFLALAAAIVHIVRRGRPIIARNRAWQRVALFARRNGLGFARRGPAADYPGLLFQRGSDRQRNQYVWSTSPSTSFREAGQIQWDQGSDDSRNTIHRTYVAFRLPRPVPHLVLDSMADGRLDVGASRVLDPRQVVPLSGDFARLYSLHAPDGYGAEAMQIFSPDVVSALVDNPLPFDLELVGQWAFLYGEASLELADPETWQRVTAFEEQVLSRLLRTTGRYVDRRAEDSRAAVTWVGDHVERVSAPPAELRSRMTTGSRVFVLVVVLFLLSTFSTVGGFFWFFLHLR